MALPTVNLNVTVAMTDRAFRYCVARFGQWEPVLRWEEFKAWGEAAAAAPTDADRHAVMVEGMAYFTGRMPGRRPSSTIQ